jgi:hypothetical protein
VSEHESHRQSSAARRPAAALAVCHRGLDRKPLSLLRLDLFVLPLGLDTFATPLRHFACIRRSRSRSTCLARHASRCTRSPLRVKPVDLQVKVVLLWFVAFITKRLQSGVRAARLPAVRPLTLRSEPVGRFPADVHLTRRTDMSPFEPRETYLSVVGCVVAVGREGDEFIRRATPAGRVSPAVRETTIAREP